MVINQSTKQALYVGVTFCLALVALGLISYHTTCHCETTVSGTTTDECTAQTIDSCKSEYPALRIHTKSGSTDNKTTCSWRTPTSIVGLVSLILSFLFLLIFAFLTCGKSFKSEFYVVAVILIMSTIATLVLMIIDIIKGSNYYKSIGSPGEYKPLSYIANIVLVFLSGLMFIFLTYVGYNLKPAVKIESKINQTTSQAESARSIQEDNTEYVESQTRKLDNLENLSSNRIDVFSANRIETSDNLDNMDKKNKRNSKFDALPFKINLREQVIKAHLQTEASHYGLGYQMTQSKFDTERSMFRRPSKE